MTRLQKKTATRIAVSALLFLAIFLVDIIFLEECKSIFTFLLYFPVYLLIGYRVLLRAGRNILAGEVFDENFLMALATVGAFLLSFLPMAEPEFAEAVFVMLFYETGEWFQSLAVGKSRRSIRALLALRPESASLLKEDGGLCVVPPEAVAVGDRVLVRAGEKIPLDGIVVKGETTVDMSPLTGESLPKGILLGEIVYGGTVNLTGVIEVEVTRLASESAVSKVLHLAESAAEKKSKEENFISAFARYYTPFIVVSALLLAFVPPLFAGNYAENLVTWLSRALTFLVVSCPCALVISVPLSFFGGIGAASRRGILVKGSAYLSALSKTETVLFDKTGTLTTGVFSLAEVFPHGISKEELLYYTAAVEREATHPLALLLKTASDRAEKAHVTDHKEYAGKGVAATVDGKRVLAGTAVFLQEVLDREYSVKETRCAEGTCVYVAVDDAYCGFVSMRDSLKESAAATVAALKEANISPVMLTGDREDTAQAVARQLGIPEYHAALLPEDKVHYVEKHIEAASPGKRVAFLGDGINDAPCIRRADIGIAMGGLGSDAAIESADVVLMEDKPERLLTAIRLSRRTMRIVKENIVLTLAVKAMVLLLGALGVAGLWLAVLADVGVALLAILNALRTLQ